MSKDDETSNNSNDPVRRVYALPQELVDRILEYQKEKGLPSEVEAARRLLDDALKSRDNMEKIINRFISRLAIINIASEAAKDVLVGHPLVDSIGFKNENVNFQLKSGEAAEITDQGKVSLYGTLKLFEWVPDSPGTYKKGSIKDSDVPF